MGAHTKRLFLGIRPARDTLQALQAYQQSHSSIAGLRWTPPANLHLTAYFFGPVPSERLENLQSLLYLALKSVNSFALAFDRYSLAPRARDPRMIWARYHKTAAFRQLVQSLHQLYQQIDPSVQIRKSPVPHITLARIKSAREVLHHDWQKGPLPADIQVQELVLWHSVLRPEGAHYEVVSRFPLIPV